MRTYEAEAVSADVYLLGECPVWDAPRTRLLWVDIPAGRIIEGLLSGGALGVVRSHVLPGTVGAVAPARDGGLIVAATDGFATVDATGGIIMGERILPSRAESRLNDGACDPAGRFLAGSAALAERRGSEWLYRLEPGGVVTTLAEDLGLSNGIGWSPDGETMYHVDSIPGTVFAQSYDPDSGAVGPRRAILTVPDTTPDGLAVDVEGNLWIACWGAGQIRCHTPEGRQVALVRVPAPNTTSAAFAGPDLDVLAITTARARMSGPALAEAPDAGRVFFADVGVQGKATAPWAGGTFSPSGRPSGPNSARPATGLR